MHTNKKKYERIPTRYQKLTEADTDTNKPTFNWFQSIGIVHELPSLILILKMMMILVMSSVVSFGCIRSYCDNEPTPPPESMMKKTGRHYNYCCCCCWCDVALVWVQSAHWHSALGYWVCRSHNNRHIWRWDVIRQENVYELQCY